MTTGRAYITKADLAGMEARIQPLLWRALLVQSFAIVGIVVALVV